MYVRWHSEFGKIWYPGKDPSFSSALPPPDNGSTLHLNAFRGEPAIAEFDWNFSATHSSSDVFFPTTRSVLHGGLTPLQPGQG
jgi:hypothetical protein